MKNYKDYIFWRVYISLITVCSLLYIIFISFLAFHNNNKKNDFFQDRTLTMETILKNKFEMINVYATQIKSHEKFIKFIYEEEIDYYNLTKLQQELKKNNTLMYKLGYSIAVKKDSEDVIVNAMNTSPSISFYKNLGIAESPEFINKKLQNLKMYETLVYDTRDNLVYFYRDYDNNYVNKFIWIIILDKIEFFRNVPVFENFTLNIKNDNKELFIFGHKNPKNILNERNSQKNLFGNEFVFIEEDMSLSKKVFYIVFVILIPIVLLGLVLYYISKSVSRSLYSPIKGLKKNLDMSDKDSIMLIENTYKKIKEQNEFLKEKAENLDLRYREKQVRDYLVGISVKRPEILKEIN